VVGQVLYLLLDLVFLGGVRRGLFHQPHRRRDGFDLCRHLFGCIEVAFRFLNCFGDVGYHQGLFGHGLIAAIFIALRAVVRFPAPLGGPAITRRPRHRARHRGFHPHPSRGYHWFGTQWLVILFLASTLAKGLFTNGSNLRRKARHINSAQDRLP